MKKLNKQAREQANDVSDPTTNANLYIDEYLYDTYTHTPTHKQNTHRKMLNLLFSYVQFGNRTEHTREVSVLG